MRLLRYSATAELDLDEIANYTQQQWGDVQADRYLNALEITCESLADTPQMGRECDWVRPGLRRMEQGSHVIFFVEEDKGILVVRILHKSMSPELHTF